MQEDVAVNDRLTLFLACSAIKLREVMVSLNFPECVNFPICVPRETSLSLEMFVDFFMMPSLM